MRENNKKYYEPLEQMMAVRHQYMAKIIKKTFKTSIYEFFHKCKILDIGCGTGEFINNYYELGSICTGIDINNNFKLKNKKNFNLVNSDIFEFLKNNKKRYDIIFMYEFLEHLGTKEKKILLKKLPSILNSNGIIFISTLSKNLISRFFSINIAENLLNLLPKNTHDHNLYLSPSDLQTLLNKNGLSIHNIEGISYNPLIKSFKLSKIDLINYFATIKN
tara:strand:- start:233 stop:889 length:657 start_codon:yes stop_codon:yes gene_type:complete